MKLDQLKEKTLRLKKYNNWKVQSPEEICKVIQIDKKMLPSDSKYKILKISVKELKNGSDFIPFSLSDFRQNGRFLTDRERQIYNGFINESPMLYMMAIKDQNSKKIRLIDGFTRAAIAIGLGYLPEAILIEI